MQRVFLEYRIKGEEFLPNKRGDKAVIREIGVHPSGSGTTMREPISRDMVWVVQDDETDFVLGRIAHVMDKIGVMPNEFSLMVSEFENRLEPAPHPADADTLDLFVEFPIESRCDPMAKEVQEALEGILAMSARETATRVAPRRGALSFRLNCRWIVEAGMKNHDTYLDRIAIVMRAYGYSEGGYRVGRTNGG